MRLSALGLLLAVVPVLLPTPSHSQAGDEWFEDLPTEALIPGGVAVMPLANGDAPKPSLRFNNKPALTVHRNGLWYGIVGLPLDVDTGEQLVNLDGAMMLLEVEKKDYPRSNINVTNSATVRPSNAQQARINRERDELYVALDTYSEAEPSLLKMQPPVAGRFTSVFGKRRYYNGQSEPKTHTGLDIAAPTGTPVVAPSPASVALVADRFITGNTVVLDHGSGMLSMYCHLSDTDVAVGDTLKTGGKLGEVGATGRVTGPHLHWSIWLNGTWVEPELFLYHQSTH